jgi:hypothetical protein
MARLLHDDCHKVEDLCEDLRDDSSGCDGRDRCCPDRDHMDCDHSGHDSDSDCDCGCEESRMRERRRRRRRRERDLIPVGTISVDCTPVSFSTGGQVRNVVSCSVSETVEVPICQTSFVPTPGPLGCTTFQPVTQTVQVPVVTTVNVPPVLVPVPRVVCPPTVCEAVRACECQ